MTVNQRVSGSSPEGGAENQTLTINFVGVFSLCTNNCTNIEGVINTLRYYQYYT